MPGHGQNCDNCEHGIEVEEGVFEGSESERCNTCATDNSIRTDDTAPYWPMWERKVD